MKMNENVSNASIEFGALDSQIDPSIAVGLHDPPDIDHDDLIDLGVLLLVETTTQRHFQL